MSKRGYISRYTLLLKRLKQKPYSTYKELQAYLEQQLTYMQLQDDTLYLGLSKRTLQRDIKEIRNIFGIDIEFSKIHKGYYISHDERQSDNFQRMVEAFEVFNTVSLSQQLTPYIFFEDKKPQGTEHLQALLYAIKHQYQIRFAYQKFWETNATLRLVAPYAIKECQHRWYLIALDEKDKTVKSFALDRLTTLEITTQKYTQTTYSVADAYHFAFGIIVPNDDVPQNIILSFNPEQGKYLKTLPLHHTQSILVDNHKELRIQLQCYITDDFLMQLCSYGSSMRVIAPNTLVATIQNMHKDAYQQYQQPRAVH